MVYPSDICHRFAVCVLHEDTIGVEMLSQSSLDMLEDVATLVQFDSNYQFACIVSLDHSIDNSLVELIYRFDLRVLCVIPGLIEL